MELADYHASRHRCAECGKIFWKYTSQWAYKRDKSYFCSYKCLRAHDEKVRAKKLYIYVDGNEYRYVEHVTEDFDDINAYSLRQAIKHGADNVKGHKLEVRYV